MNNVYIYTVLLIGLVACQKPQKAQQTDQLAISDDSLLNLVQYQTFNYFWEGAEPVSGMAPERIHTDGDYPDKDPNVVTSGGSGFGVMAILVGIERGFISRQQGVERFEKILNFLETADKFHGVYPHWWYGDTGKVKPFGANDNGSDLVETAFLMQGLLCVRQYFREGSDREKSIANRINEVWKSVEWDWHTRNGQDVLYWHWSPDKEWIMNFAVTGYNECLIMYVLGASSPTHSIKSSVYHSGWAKSGEIVNDSAHSQYGYHLDMRHNDSQQFGGPLFWAHYSYLGLDPRQLKDRYADYWQHNVNHTLINRQWCIENPLDYEGYGADCWGLTASYSPRFYAAHRPKEEDFGVITPTAALSSFPYTPEYSMDFLRFIYASDSLIGKYGPYDAFSLEHDWYKPWYLAIDQGPIPVMIENYRTGLLWKLFMSAPEVRAGLEKLGFEYE
ncbi:MAG: glucoamylase family protein [Marinoscillum sp.]